MTGLALTRWEKPVTHNQLSTRRPLVWSKNDVKCVDYFVCLGLSAWIPSWFKAAIVSAHASKHVALMESAPLSSHEEDDFWSNFSSKRKRNWYSATIDSMNWILIWLWIDRIKSIRIQVVLDDEPSRLELQCFDWPATPIWRMFFFIISVDQFDSIFDCTCIEKHPQKSNSCINQSAAIEMNIWLAKKANLFWPHFSMDASKWPLRVTLDFDDSLS